MELADTALFTIDESTITGAISKIYKEKGFTPEILGTAEGKALIHENYRVLSQAVDSGVEQSKKGGVNYEVGADLVSALKNDAFMFSGWKAYHTMREAGINLLNDKGGIKTLEQFKKEAGAIFKQQGLNLRAEYNHAERSTIMATKWARFAEDGDRYDLQYRTVGDNKVRDAHRQLNGYVAPLNSAFWDSYYPPNGWGCRCDVQQVRKGKYTNTITDEEATSAGAQSTVGDKQRIFRTNPGKLKKVFPPKHPNLPKGCEGCKYKNGVKLAYSENSNLCKACQILDICKKENTKTETRKWINKFIDKMKPFDKELLKPYLQYQEALKIHKNEIKNGTKPKNAIPPKKPKCVVLGCGVSRELMPLPTFVLDFCKKNNIKVSGDMMCITDKGIFHALRLEKRLRNQTVNDEDIFDIATLLPQCRMYYNRALNNFNFIMNRESDGKLIKYVFQTNSNMPSDYKLNPAIQFITAGVISSEKDKDWVKLEK